MKLKPLLFASFKIARPLNLLIICLAYFLFRYFLINPILLFSGTASSLSVDEFNLLVLVILAVTTGGYIINDYFDRRIDSVNKPGKNVVDEIIPGRVVITLYFTLTFLAVAGAVLLSIKAHIRYLVPVIITSAGLLYFYSSLYKKMFLAGNLLVAILTALSIFCTILFDANALQSKPVLILVTAYTVFAFLLTLSREIVKDCEDLEGDASFGAWTLPSVLGLGNARIVAAFVTGLAFAGLLIIQVLQRQWEDKIPFAYVSLFIQLPLIVMVFRIPRSNTKKDDKINSLLLKLIMITGILSVMVFYFSFF